MPKDNILKELENEFSSIKKEMKFNASLEELDKIFYIKDLILQQGFVSKTLSRVLCSRICSTFNSWTNYMHGLIVPNPISMIGVSENSIFDDKDKEHIMSIMKVFLAFVSQNTVIGLTKDQSKEAKFIDDSLKVWSENVDFLIGLSKRTNEYWNKEIKQELKK